MKWKTKALVMTISALLVLVGGSIGYFEIRGIVPERLNDARLLAVGEKTKSLKDIIFETQKYVVMIETDNGNQGSGFVYNELGDLITNAHVVTGARYVKVKTSDARELQGEVIGISTEVDIA